MSYYPERINEHFLNPRNTGEVSEPDATGNVGSFTCGALLRLTLKIDMNARTVTDAKFKATGCGFLIACASALTDTIKDLAVSRAATLQLSAVTDWFGEIPAERRHCAALCQEALQKALSNYHDTTLEEWTGEEALICTCFGVSERTIERAVRERSLLTVEEVTHACNAGGGCGSCHMLIIDILEDHWRTFDIEGIGAGTGEP